MTDSIFKIFGAREQDYGVILTIFSQINHQIQGKV